jgi:hypothetical protein
MAEVAKERVVPTTTSSHDESRRADRGRDGYGGAGNKERSNLPRGRFLVPGLRPLLNGIARVSFGTVQVDLSRNYTSRERKYKYQYQDDGDDDRPMNKARIKIYRRVAFDPYVFNRNPAIDLAAGLQIGTDGETLTPKCRLKVGPHMRLKMFPVPAFQYKQLFRTPHSSKFVVEANCVLPLQSFREMGMGEIPKQPYLGIRLRNDVSTGLHLTSKGIEFDERVDIFGPYGTLRAAVQVDFPTEFPLKRENGPPLHLSVRRLSMTIPTP